MNTSDGQSSVSELRREPRHLTLARDFQTQIRSGQLSPGDRLPSFTELRELWGVGRDTLERMYKVLENEGLITREHRRGIFVAHADAHAPKKNGTIGFVNGENLISHPYYSHLLEGVRNAADRANVEVLLLSEKSSIRWEKVDGLIFQATVGECLGPQSALPHMPNVALIYAQPQLDSAVADDYVGMTEAVEHLWQLGHRRIALLTLEMQPHAMSRQRISAYQDVLRSHGVEPLPDWARCMHEPHKSGRTWEATGSDEMRQWLQEDWGTLGCTALLAQNDEVAIGAIEALHDAGLAVPDDISVVGFDGTEIAQFYRPRLTTVKVPLMEIGAAGFELLMRQINRPLLDSPTGALPVRMTLPTKLQVGRSSGPAPE